MVDIMAVIKVWDDVPIDTSSTEVKNKVSQSISNYVLDHWDECVHTAPTESEGKYEVDFFINL